MCLLLLFSPSIFKHRELESELELHRGGNYELGGYPIFVVVHLLQNWDWEVIWYGLHSLCGVITFKDTWLANF